MSPTPPTDELRYRDSSPTSPSPLSPVALPQWIRQSRRHATLMPGSRLKILLAALCCVGLGWTLTSMFESGETAASEAVYSSSGYLENPTSFGDDGVLISPQPGIIGDEVETAHDGSLQEHRPSVAGALAELHDAVKDKFHHWNPYGSKQAESPHNNTSHVASASIVRPTTGEDIKDGMSEEERLGARIRIGKCTILFNGNSFWERAIRTHERHDREHGYRLHILRQDLLDDVWSKPAYILSLLLRELAKAPNERLDWLFWVDADTIILNPYIPIDVFLPPPGTEFDDVHLIYSNDWNGLNNGVFPIRVNQWSVRLFSAIAAFRHYRPDEPLQFRDQSAMDQLMHEPEFVNNIVQAPQRWFNAYQGEHNETLAPYQIRRGDFLVHFAGVVPREERMGYWLERAEQHLDDWEVPVKSTSYPQEVKDFWNEQRVARQQKKQELARAQEELRDAIEQTNQRLATYGARLNEEQKKEIEEQRGRAQHILDDEQLALDKEALEEAVQKLENSSQPLVTAISEAQKVLLNHAHEAIFAAEKDLLEAGYNGGVTTAELDKISEAVKNLKNLVMTPQEHWDHQVIVSATNAVTEARVELEESQPVPNPIVLEPGSTATTGEAAGASETLVVDDSAVNTS